MLEGGIDYLEDIGLYHIWVPRTMFRNQRFHQGPLLLLYPVTTVNGQL